MNFKKTTAVLVSLVMTVSGAAITANANSIEEKDGRIYCLDDSGKSLTGWQTIDVSEYYFKKDGSAVVKNALIGGVMYKFGSDGVCKGKFSGVVTRKGEKYYYKNGIMQTGWITRKGNTYYFGSDGRMRTGILQNDVSEYDLGDDGVWDGNKGKITVSPETVGEYLDLTDFASMKAEFRIGGKGFKTLENVSELFALMENESDCTFESGSSPSDDETEMPDNIYSNISTDIMIRFLNEDGNLVGGWYFSKDKSGTGYLYCSLRNIGAVLGSSDIYDMLKEAYTS